MKFDVLGPSIRAISASETNVNDYDAMHTKMLKGDAPELVHIKDSIRLISRLVDFMKMQLASKAPGVLGRFMHVVNQTLWLGDDGKAMQGDRLLHTSEVVREMRKNLDLKLEPPVGLIMSAETKEIEKNQNSATTKSENIFFESAKLYKANKLLESPSKK